MNKDETSGGKMGNYRKETAAARSSKVTSSLQRVLITIQSHNRPWGQEKKVSAGISEQQKCLFVCILNFRLCLKPSQRIFNGNRKFLKFFLYLPSSQMTKGHDTSLFHLFFLFCCNASETITACACTYVHMYAYRHTHTHIHMQRVLQV